MKQNIPYIYMYAAWLLLCLLPVGCADELDVLLEPRPAVSGAGAPVRITVTDGGYAFASPGTRAIDQGYTTCFEKGDTIGIYQVTYRGYGNKNGDLIYAVFDGTKWEVDPTGSLTYFSSDSIQTYYFARYPYSKHNVSFQNAEDSAQEYFRDIIDAWSPATDQSTHEAYTASDLMIAKGEVKPSPSGGYELTFRMEHQMNLALLRVPATECTTPRLSPTGGELGENTYLLYAGLVCPNAWIENSHTGRHLLHPDKSTQLPIQGSYYAYNTTAQKQEFSTTIQPTGQWGTSHLYTIDGGKRTQTPRELKVGDYYMRDGSILPGDAFPGDLPTEVRKDCIGIVFSVTDPTEDDPSLKRDHPHCTHGLVVALGYARSASWSSTEEQVNNWTNASDRGAYQVDITLYQERQGYANTRALREYNKVYPGKKVLPVESVDEYAKQNPSPPESSGWYWPSAQELYFMKSNGINFQKAGGV